MPSWVQLLATAAAGCCRGMARRWGHSAGITAVGNRPGVCTAWGMLSARYWCIGPYCCLQEEGEGEAAEEEGEEEEAEAT